MKKESRGRSAQPAGSRSLAGRRILITRARQQAGKLAAALRRLGATVLEIPSIEIRPPRSYQPLDAALERVHEYDWLILTSVNGVQALFARLAKLKIGPRRLCHLRIAAIGPATKKEIESHHLKVHIVPKEYVAESVVEALRGQAEGKRVLLARAKVARDVIPRELRRAGAKVEVIEAYETVVPESSRQRLRQVLDSPGRRPHAITFTSSSTARNFVALLDSRRPAAELLQGITLASIGPVTSSTLRELGLPVHVESREYTIPGLVQALAESLANR